MPIFAVTSGRPTPQPRFAGSGFSLITELGPNQARRLADAGASGDGHGGGGGVDDSELVQGDWFRLIWAGRFHSEQYGEIELTPADIQQMMRNWQQVSPAGRGELPIDYDHLGDAPQAPGDGRASGWIRSVRLANGGRELWCLPMWTKPAARMLKAREYRYISPYFLTNYMDKATGRRVGMTLRAAALTNRPFLEGMGDIPAPAIAASDTIRRAFHSDRRLAVPVAMSHGRRATPNTTTRQATMAVSRITNKPGAKPAPKPAARAMAEPPVPPRHRAPGPKAPHHAPPPAPMEEEPPAPGLTCPHCGAPVKHQGQGDGAGPAPETGSPHVPDAHTEPDGDEAMGDAPVPGAEMSALEPDEGGIDPTESEPEGTEPGPDGGSEPPEPDVEGTGHIGMAELNETRRQLAEANRRIAALEGRDRRALADRYIADALQSGKVTMAQLGTVQKPGPWRAMAFRDPAGFKALVDSMPKGRVPQGEIGSADPTAADDATAISEKVNQLVEVKMSDVAARTGKTADYSSCLKMVLSENPTLAQAYDRAMIGERRPGSSSTAPQAIRRL